MRSPLHVMIRIFLLIVSLVGAATLGCKLALNSDLYSLATKFAHGAPTPFIMPAALPAYQFNLVTVPTITISTPLPGAVIHYSIDNEAANLVYSGPFLLPLPADTLNPSTIILRAYSSYPDCEDSPIAIQAYQYVLTVPAPVIAPFAEPAFNFTVNSVPLVSITCAQSGATVHYSIDSPTVFSTYSGSFSVPVPSDTTVHSDIVVRAYATLSGYTDSSVSTQVYHFVPTVLTPAISPAPASYYQYNLPPTITLTCPQAGVTLHYSVDSTTAYAVYAAPFAIPVPADWSVNRDIVIRAYASASGFADSLVASMTYPFLARGTILTLAGTGSASYSGDGGSSTLAAVNGPKGVVADGAGNVYIGDTGNNRVRKIDVATGNISTFAGTGTAGYLGDGAAATAARLSGPSSLAIDNNYLYISDTGNHCVRIVDLATGLIDTYAGTGTAGYTGDGGPASSAQLSGQTGLMLDSNEKNLYIADTGNNCVRKIVIATGYISTVAGTGTAGYTGDGGLATAATLSAPRGVGLRQTTKNLYIADTANHCIRMVNSSTGYISTIAGTGGTPGFTGNGGLATAALLNGPTRLVVTNTAVYVTDTGNHCVRMIDGAIIYAFAGTGSAGFSGDRGPASAAALSSPSEVFMSNKGNFIADTNNNRIRKILVY